MNATGIVGLGVKIGIENVGYQREQLAGARAGMIEQRVMVDWRDCSK